MYLIPANSKKGQLIFNMFRPIDLVIFAAGACATLIMMFVIPDLSMITLIIKLAPVVVCALLVMPIPNYHNVLMFLKDAVAFYSNRRIYLWKGWCVMDEFSEKQ